MKLCLEGRGRDNRQKDLVAWQRPADCPRSATAPVYRGDVHEVHVAWRSWPPRGMSVVGGSRWQATWPASNMGITGALLYKALVRYIMSTFESRRIANQAYL